MQGIWSITQIKHVIASDSNIRPGQNLGPIPPHLQALPALERTSPAPHEDGWDGIDPSQNIFLLPAPQTSQPASTLEIPWTPLATWTGIPCIWSQIFRSHSTCEAMWSPETVAWNFHDAVSHHWIRFVRPLQPYFFLSRLLCWRDTTAISPRIGWWKMGHESPDGSVQEWSIPMDLGCTPFLNLFEEGLHVFWTWSLFFGPNHVFFGPRVTKKSGGLAGVFSCGDISPNSLLLGALNSFLRCVRLFVTVGVRLSGLVCVLSPFICLPSCVSLSGGVCLAGLVCALSPFICLPSCVSLSGGVRLAGLVCALVSLHLSPIMCLPEWLCPPLRSCLYLVSFHLSPFMCLPEWWCPPLRSCLCPCLPSCVCLSGGVRLAGLVCAL